MRAAVLRSPGPAECKPLEVESREAPRAGPGQVVIAVHACAVCRTDLQLCEGELALRRSPIVPGHQIVGHITELGDGARDLAVGDRVGVAWIGGTCGGCRFCKSGRENLCEQATFTGWDHDGGFATHAVADHRFVYRLPNGYSDNAAAPLLCAGVIGYRALRVAGVAPRQRVGLFGFGASATIVSQIARFWDCEIFVVTRSAAEQERARRLGATWAGGYDEPVPVPLDAAITFAPVGDVVIAALKAVDRGASVVVNAIHLDRIPEFPYELLWWERSLRSVANVTRQDVIELLDLATRAGLVTEYESYPLERANDALVDLREGRVHAAAVLELSR